MITFIAESKYGCTGQYVARITGRDSKFTFNREFTGRKEGKRGETTRAEVDQPGLYEVCDVTKRGKDSSYFVMCDTVIEHGELAGKKTQAKKPIDKAEAMKLAKAMDEGRRFEDMVVVKNVGLGSDGTTRLWDYEILSKTAAAKTQAGVTLQQAQDACWAVLQKLPENEAKKVLAALRKLVSPKPEQPKPEQPMPADTPVEVDAISELVPPDAELATPDDNPFGG